MNGIEKKINKIKQLKDIVKQIKDNIKVVNQCIDYQIQFKEQKESNVNPFVLDIISNQKVSDNRSNVELISNLNIVVQKIEASEIAYN